MRFTMIPAVAALAVACTSGQTDRPAGNDAGSETGMSAGDTATTGTPMGQNAPSLSGIFSRLELANTAEIEVSRLATNRARSPAVKDVARQLVSEHTKNRDELEALAGRKGVDMVPAEGGSTKRDTSGVLALKGLEGAAFDSAYVEAQIQAHRENLDAIQGQLLPSTQDPEVRQYLEKTQAAMQKHLASLEQAQGRLKS